VSVDGAEEDGVDNRVEAPTWVPDGGSDKAADEQSEGESATTPDTEGTESVITPSDRTDSPASAETAEPDTSEDPWSRTNGSSQAADADDPWARVSSTPQPADADDPWSPPAASGTPSPAANGAAQNRNGATPPPSLMAPAAAPAGVGSTTTPLASAAGAARGLAAKVSAPFSGLSKPRSKPKAPPKASRPATAPPRPQGVRPQPRLTPGQMTGPQTRRAQLKLDRIEPWSVMKFSFLISLVGWVILLIAVSLLYFTLSKLGVFTSIEHTVGLVTTSKSKPGSNAASWFKASRVLGYTMLVGAVNVILLTALATIGAVLYNLVTMLAGGIEVTLKESD
jgi:Transmembrane domain of unknown function (DUF3566)